MFGYLINVVEKNGVTFDELELVILQLATNVVVLGADGDVLGAGNPAQIVASKSTVSDIMKVSIFLYRVNGQKYKQIRDGLENEFSKETDNYPTTVEHAVHLLNTYKIKF